MEDYRFQFFPKGFLSNVIVFIGKQPGENEIQVMSKPSFFDAVHLTEQQSPAPLTPSYQFIPLAGSLNETYHYYDPHLSKNIKFIFNGKSLKLIEEGDSLTKEAVYNVYKHFLVKKGKRVLFLTEAPKDKIHLKQKLGNQVQSEEKIL